MLSGKRQSLSITPGPYAPIINAVLSVPVAVLFSLAIQGSLSYIIAIVSLGLLISLDLRRGLGKLLLGFAVSFLASVYAIANSVLGRGLSMSPYGDWSLLAVALPPSLGVLVAGLFLSDRTRYKMVVANVVASATLAIGFGIGSGMQTSVNASSNLSISTPLALLLLGFPANGAQIVLLHFLNKLWKAKKFSLAMMPTAFFAYNLLSVYAYLVSQDVSQLYAFISSLGFLPVLVVVGVGSGSLAGKVSRGVATVPTTAQAMRPTAPPSIIVRGDTSVRPGREQRIMVATQSGGKRRDMGTIDATITRPGGGTDSLRLSHVGAGEYKAFYQPRASGSYAVHIVAVSKDHMKADQSFSFTVQAPPVQHPPPATRPPIPQSRPPPAPPPRPPPAAPMQRSGVPIVGPSIPRLDGWDPKVWVNQEVHGYTIREHLATGLTGYVLRASFGQAGTEMAIKIPILRSGTAAHALDETMSEATRLLELSEQSKYVVQLRGILLDRLNVQEILKGNTALYLKSPPAIVMELMKGGTAKRLLEDLSYDSLFYSEKWGSIIMLIGYMIATGLETIHKAGFVHLDVKPQNILFNVKPPATGLEMIDQMRSGTLVPKLADLGSAVRVGGKVAQFTPEYAPGEQVLGSSAAPKMDIYALGASLYNLLTKTPVTSKKLLEMMNSVTNNPDSSKAANDLKSAWNVFDPDFSRVANFPSAIPVLRKMLARDPQQRLEAGEVASSLRNLGGMTRS